jgi:NADH:ubiquinone reductase (H+-translocating)
VKEVVVLGGGFGGVSSAVLLAKKLKKNEANITLIDRNSFHLFRASLYEVATNEEPKKNIAIPFSAIFQSKINVVKGEVENINTNLKQISLKNGKTIDYDYLIVALGAESSDYNIEGVSQNALTLQWLEDAVVIREKVRGLFNKKVKEGQRLKVLVAGGGFTGCEFTAELVNFRQKLSRHDKNQERLMEISIIQGPESLLKELDEKVSKLAYERLKRFGVNIILGSHVKRVEKDIVETDKGEKLNFDILIWTCGIKANRILISSGFSTDKRGLVYVNKFLQVEKNNDIFAIGDNALYVDASSGIPVPQVAEVAEKEGRIAAENVIRSIRGEKLVPYEFTHLGYIIPLKGRFAVAELAHFRLVGFMGWVVQQIVFLRYLLGVLPALDAIKRWNRFEVYLNENI